MAKLSVLLAYNPAPEDEAYLRGLLNPSVQLSIADRPPDHADFEILVQGRPSKAWLKASKKLKAVIIPFAGLPQSTADIMAGYPEIKLFNLHHNAVPVAEMAVALLLAVARRIPDLDRHLRLHDWTPRYQEVRQSVVLQGRNALVLGYGHIGRRVADLCRAMGMQVRAIKRTPAFENGDLEVFPIESLPDLLPWAQIVIVCLPFTSETRGLLDEDLLGKLSSEAMIINVSRGETIDEKALYRALTDGSIAAAGLDVWFNYPADAESRSQTAPSTYPFEKLDNVVLTPHMAGLVKESEKLRMEHLAVLINQLAEGRQPSSEIDLARGY